MLAAPEFLVPELVQMLHQVEIAAELQHRVLADRVVGGDEGAEVQTWHERISWVVMMGRTALGSAASVPQRYHPPPRPGHQIMTAVLGSARWAIASRRG